MSRQLNMSDASDSDGKIRLHKKRDTRNRKDKMTKYYSDPEKQEKLKQRIAEYEETSRRYQLKANQLKEFLQPQISAAVETHQTK